MDSSIVHNCDAMLFPVCSHDGHLNGGEWWGVLLAVENECLPTTKPHQIFNEKLSEVLSRDRAVEASRCDNALQAHGSNRRDVLTLQKQSQTLRALARQNPCVRVVDVTVILRRTINNCQFSCS